MAKDKGIDGIKDNIKSKLIKLNFLGFEESVEPPWLIMRSPTGGAYWFNEEHNICGSKLYKEIDAYRDIIICYIERENGQKVEKVEMYSVDCLDRNIIEGFTDAKFISNKRNIYTKGLFGYVGCALFEVTYKNKDMFLIVSRDGNKLIIPKADKILILNESSDEDVLITLYANDKCSSIIYTDQSLNILRKSIGLEAINI